MMIHRKHFRLVALALFVMVAAFSVAARQAEKGSGLATGEPGMNTYTAGPPGETVPLERPYGIAPPVVPHDVTEFEISRSSNDCLGCHLEGLEVSEGHVATRVPSSHRINEFTGEREEETVADIRYNCLQCHVPRSTAEELL